MTRDEMFENVCDVIEDLHGKMQVVGLSQDEVELLVDLEQLLDEESARIVARFPAPAPATSSFANVRSCGDLGLAHEWRVDICDQCGGAIGEYCRLCGMYGGPAHGHEHCDCIPF